MLNLPTNREGNSGDLANDVEIGAQLAVQRSSRLTEQGDLGATWLNDGHWSDIDIIDGNVLQVGSAPLELGVLGVQGCGEQKNANSN